MPKHNLYDRSFIKMPSGFLFPAFNNSLKTVGQKEALAFLWRLSKSADYLDGVERDALLNWLVKYGYEHYGNRLADVYTVQYSHQQCASFLGCDEKQARRYRQDLVKAGYLIQVKEGKKNSAALFILYPQFEVKLDNSNLENRGTETFKKALFQWKKT